MQKYCYIFCTYCTSSAIPTPRKRTREEITEDYTNQLKKINTTEEDNFNTIFQLPNGDERMAEIRKRNRWHRQESTFLRREIGYWSSPPSRYPDPNLAATLKTLQEMNATLQAALPATTTENEQER